MASRIERLIRIYNRLRRGHVTIEIIKKWCFDVNIQISERQLYRDLDDIGSYLRFDKEKLIVFENEKNRKVWKIEFEGKEESLTTWDINSFYLLKHFAPRSISITREASLNKLEKILYPQVSKSKFEKLSVANTLLFNSTNFFEYAHDMFEHKLLEDIIWAIQNQKKLIIDKNTHESTCLQRNYNFPALLCPLSIVNHRGAIYISFYEEKSRDYFFLAMYQLINVELTNLTFNRRKLERGFIKYQSSIFGVTGNIDKKIYNILIETTHDIGESFAKYKCHASQEVVFSKNGKTYLKFNCGINRELVSYVAMWFDHMKVLKPLKLKKILIQKLKDTDALYLSTRNLADNNEAFISKPKKK